MKSKILLSLLLSTSVISGPVYAEGSNYYKRLKIQQERSKNIKRKRISLKDIFKWQKRKPRVVEEVRVVTTPPKVKKTQYHTYEVVGRSAIKLAPAKIIVATAHTDENQETLVTNNEDKVTISHLSRDLVLADDLKFSAETHIAKAITQHYEDNNAYLWINEEGGWNARARSVLRVLGAADKYGLNNQDYKFDFIGDNEGTQTTKEKAAARVKNEIMLTTAALRYAMDASFGVVNPNKISGYHDFPVHYAKTNDLLDDIAQHKLPANVLKKLHPQSEKFLALKEELANLVGVKSDTIELNTDVLIRPGDTSADLPSIVNAIQQRGSKNLLNEFSDVFSSSQSSTQYNARLVELVKAYQKEAKLTPDGIIGRGTASKLAGISSSNKADKVKLAMERMRWLPDQFGAKHVFINQPEYKARYIVNGKEKIAMRVVVGKKSNQTNFFYDEIEHVEYNPYWNVPRSIIINEFLPKSLGNPSYLDGAGYEVHSASGPISSASINWGSVSSYPNFTVRQPPGAKNALGELKIMFPNRHAIYMHDTPSKSLFKKRVRAFSHGCIRLHDPRGMAAILLGKDKNYIKRQVEQGENLTEPLPSKVPVYVSYFTAWPQEDGSMGYFNDMYARDAYLNKALAATYKARSIDIAS